MAVGPATSASISDLRGLVQPQEPVRPAPEEQAAAEQDSGVDTAQLDTAASQPAAGVQESPSNRGENDNPGVAAQARDDRLPNSGDPNRGTTLDIAV
ncbi:hypothetical protein NUH88_14185 [Nisaea acidiphila]|uniref:Uncharacterized protein n=1 Tax=Nisaea acidiphila TaxID=1862145 RepID=A0A9J7AN15_9PROT|nr:hypothetical protein [Nisaea acidiphila]UUX48558.1 hypothetical protein NUH88_14185 [Nisaea acidiphila]